MSLLTSLPNFFCHPHPPGEMMLVSEGLSVVVEGDGNPIIIILGMTLE